MMFLSNLCFGPPKNPRNVFFPWQILSIHQSGAFLEKNRLALKVPINLTKLEIREYLRKIYGARVIKVNTLIKIPRILRNFSNPKANYYRNGPMYKKAIITLEDSIPNEVKMIQSAKNIGRNPAITKKNISYGVKTDMKTRTPRQALWSMGISQNSWKQPIPNLLAGDDWNLDPKLEIDENYTQMRPDPSLPFMHTGVSGTSRKPDHVPPQFQPQFDISPWRRRLTKGIEK